MKIPRDGAVDHLWIEDVPHSDFKYVIRIPDFFKAAFNAAVIAIIHSGQH